MLWWGYLLQKITKNTLKIASSWLLTRT